MNDANGAAASAPPTGAVATLGVGASASQFRQPLLLMLAAFVILWTAYEVIAHGAGDVHNDMAEAYAWGKELQAGYFKHPPFWAWLTYVWFQIFPVEDWSAYLFSAVNSAAGIYLVSRCASYFLDDKRLQLVAAMLLILVPAYTFHAMKMNANTILLSLWPGITLAFLSVMARPRATSALLLGLLASCAMLSKYNSMIFLACVFAASLVHPDGRRFWLSRYPLLVVIGFAPLVAIHVWWLWQNDFLPFSYFGGLRGKSNLIASRNSLLFLGAQALYVAPAIAAIAILGWRCGMTRLAFRATPIHRVLLILALGPPLLTALLGAALHTRTPALWGLPNLFLLPTLALQFLQIADVGKLQRRLTGVIWAFLLTCVTVSPIVAWVKFNYGDPASIDPRSQLARELTGWWRATYGSPLRIVGGDSTYALAATFYSPDHPSYFISSDRRLTPWITDARLHDSGALLICNEIDEACEQESARMTAGLGDPKKISAVKEFLGQHGQDKNFSFFVIPPKAYPSKGAE